LSEPLEEAAALEEAGRFFEAALAYEKARDPRRAFENLVRLTSTHPQYREACRRAVRLAAAGEGPTLAFENLVAVFVRSGPADEADLDAFRALSDLYEDSGFPENAVEVLQKIVGARPDDATAAERLAKLRPSPGQLPGLPALKRPTLRVPEPVPTLEPV